MPQISPGLHALNAGTVSELALGRVDLTQLRLAAETQENLLPMVLGPARFRPGTAYKAQTYNNGPVRFMPFVFNAATKALIEVSQAKVRILLDGVPLTRPAVTAAVTNGEFTTDISGWTDASAGGATISWATGALVLQGTGTAFAEARQQVTVNEPNVEHALRIDVRGYGAVVLAVGSTAGAADYIAETALRHGYHSIAFTPTGNFHITFKSDGVTRRRVTSVQVEAAGAVELLSPWGTSYDILRYAQSGDVLFVACDAIEQRRIERRSQRSWSLALYQTADGPFRSPNGSTITLTPNGVSGTVTLTASRAVFLTTHAGSLWQLFHNSQTQTGTLSGADQAIAAIRVTGLAGRTTTRRTETQESEGTRERRNRSTSTRTITNNSTKGGGGRVFTIRTSGLSSTGSVVTLQRSFGVEGTWEDVKSFTANTLETYDDGFDNQIVFYRLAVKAGDYAAGSIVCTLTYSSGAQVGVVRFIDYVSATEFRGHVLSTLGGTTATTDWDEGEWSDYRGFPSTVAFHDGRLWWGWKDRIFGSVSDEYDSFNIFLEGDAGPVIRSIATGGVEGIRWLLSVQRLLAGTASQEVSLRSSSFDEPITPTQFTAREFSNRGCANLPALSVDGRGIFVQRNERRVYEASMQAESNDYISRDLTRFALDIAAVGIVDMAVQRQPDTRIWFILADGNAAVLTYEPDDDVVGWSTVTTNGDFKAVGVLPGEDEDDVYFAVERVNSGGTITCIEVLAKHSECVGATLSKNMDSHIVVSQASSTTISGLAHLQGLSVVAWGNGIPYPGPFTVTAGAITLPAAVTSAVVGLPYDGLFKSSKLAHGAATGSAVGKQKRVDHVALLMADVGWYGVTIGKDLTTMTKLPATLGNGRPLAITEVLDAYDYGGAPFNGGWGPDSRVCVKVSSPYPATFQGVVIGMQTNEPQTYGTRQTG